MNKLPMAYISTETVVINGEVFPIDDPLPACKELSGDNLTVPKIKSLVLVANTRKTAARIARISTPSLARHEQWGLIEKSFLLSDKFNENTHVFDGCIFNKNGQSRFFMTALPIDICDIFAKVGERITGSIRRVERLDTIEHILFEKYAQEDDESILVILPQEDGLRILHILKGLPNAVHYISANPLHREDEFMWFLNVGGVISCEKLRLIFIGDADYNWLCKLCTKTSIDFTQEIQAL
ncbi:MAG: hypothetical protein FWF81_05945 [Defluviitaleaceae bacterium]|nr:hypothetical protein [Defluviitaleaceae bacterium]